jgi:hypothetical protein
LSAFTGGKGELEESGLLAWADTAHVGFDNGVAALETLLAQALPHLCGTVGVLVEHAHDVGLKGIEFACARRGPFSPVVVLGEPIGDGARVERQTIGDLPDMQAVLVVELFDLTKLLIIDHDSASQIRSKTALISTVSC